MQQERELIGGALHLLPHHIGAAVTGVTLDAQQDRRIRCLIGLQRRRELARVHRIHAVVVVRGVEQDRRIRVRAGIDRARDVLGWKPEVGIDEGLVILLGKAGLQQPSAV